jgi:hypothetical protein
MTMTDSDKDSMFGKDLRVYTKITTPPHFPIDNDIVVINGVKYQKVEKSKKPQTLYQMLYDDELPVAQCKIICEFVEGWMSQYNCETNKWDEDYSSGWEDLMDTLKKGLG